MISLGVPMFLGAMVAAGCSQGDGLARQAVSGTVTLDGQPLAQGSIQFMTTAEADGHVMSEGSLIRDGHYEIARDHGLVPGTYRVSLNSTKGRGQGSPEPAGDLGKDPVDLIPDRYNVKSTLTAEVKVGAVNQFDYDVHAK